MQPSDSITNELVDDGLCGLDLVNDSGSLTHQPGAGIVQCLVIDIVVKLLKVVFDRNDTLRSKILDISSAVLLPVLDVWVVANTEWSSLEAELAKKSLPQDLYKELAYGKDDGADVVIKSGSSDSILVGLWSTGFIGQDESSSDPHSRSTKHESCSHRLAVEETSGSNDLNGLIVHWALLALNHLDNCGDEDGCGDISGVTTSLSSLGANDIHTGVKTFLDVLRVTDHVHI